MKNLSHTKKRVLLGLCGLAIGFLAYTLYANYSYRFEPPQNDIQKAEGIYQPPFSFSQSTDHEGYQKPSDEELQKYLTPLQFHVTQEEGTERPFHNEYWDNKKDGIYVDIVSGEPLYSSTDKFDSGTGWPSFLKPIEDGVVTEHDDYKLIVKRIEIRSTHADNHIGHIIMDGPASNNFVRHCMNSAAMRFVPVEKLAEEGYERYLHLFEQ